MPFNATVLLPSEHGIAGQLGSVIADHQRGIATMLGNGVQLATDAAARDRVVDNRCQAFLAVVVDDAEDPEPTAIDQRV